MHGKQVAIKQTKQTIRKKLKGRMKKAIEFMIYNKKKRKCVNEKEEAKKAANTNDSDKIAYGISNWLLSYFVRSACVHSIQSVPCISRRSLLLA